MDLTGEVWATETHSGGTDGENAVVGSEFARGDCLERWPGSEPGGIPLLVVK